jgi:hypothetical protein
VALLVFCGCAPDIGWDGTCKDEVFEGEAHPRELSSIAGYEVVEGSVAINFDVTEPEDLEYVRCLERIEGALQLLGYDEPQRVPEDLSALSSLRVVSERLYISSTTIETLDGLEGLEVAGHVTLAASRIRDVDGLRNLREANGLHMRGGTMLENVDGLSNIKQLDSLFIYYGHPSLESIDGFRNLESIGGLLLDWCPLDGDLSAFSGLTSLQSAHIGWPFVESTSSEREWEYCPLIETLEPFSGVSALEGLSLHGTSVASLDGPTFARDMSGLALRSNEALVDLSALSDVRSIESDLWIEVNPDLTQLDHLNPDLDGSLETLGGELSIHGNESLPTCAAEHLRDALIARGWTGESQTPNADCPDGTACSGSVCE